LGPRDGYWFARSAWGQGYATDLVSASLAFARERCVPLVSAFARPANGASCRVLEKSGLRLERYVENMALSDLLIGASSKQQPCRRAAARPLRRSRGTALLKRAKAIGSATIGSAPDSRRSALQA